MKLSTILKVKDHHSHTCISVMCIVLLGHIISMSEAFYNAAVLSFWYPTSTLLDRIISISEIKYGRYTGLGTGCAPLLQYLGGLSLPPPWDGKTNISFRAE